MSDSPFSPQPGHPDVARHPETTCPVCGHKLDSVSSADDPTGALPRMPEEGDYCICIECVTPMKFRVGAFGVRMELLEGEELAEFKQRFARQLEIYRSVSHKMQAQKN